MKIWAHRGCSQLYPENTLTSFKKAAELYDKGLTGIELDVQLTKDREIVVIHDERIDRTTEGVGFVRDYTLEELKSINIRSIEPYKEHIPTLYEVINLLEPYLKRGMLLNIELKNSVYPYEGMEEMVVSFVRNMDIEKQVIYSSFNIQSLVRLFKLNPDGEFGVLGSRLSDCIEKRREYGISAALHPNGKQIDVDTAEFDTETVRAWFLGHLYPDKPTGIKMDLVELERQGVTDVFLNEPEVCLIGNKK